MISTTPRLSRWSTGVLLLAIAVARPTLPASAGQVAPPTASPTPATTDAAPPPPPAIGDGIGVELPAGRVRLLLEEGPRETGLPVVFRVEVSSDAGDAGRVGLPAPGTMLGEFEVLPSPDATAGGVEDDRARRWAIRTFGSGTVTLPSMSIELDGAEAMTEPRSIEIGSVAGLDTDPASFRDIAEAVEVTAPSVATWWWIVGLAAIGAGLLFWWWRRRETTPPPPEPADAWALARLDALLAEGLVEQGRVQAFFYRLTDVARAFIERRFDLAAPDRTTAEFIAEARRHPELGEEVARLLGNLLRAADMVKFAGDRPAGAECARAAETIRRFVVESGPRPDSLEDDSRPEPRSTPRKAAVDRVVEDLDRLETRS